MILLDVYEPDGCATFATVNFLYMLLAERTPEESISHRRMPTFSEHLNFVESRPYARWQLIQHGYYPCGAVYLTRNREVGIAIRQTHRGQGLGSLALGAFLRKLNDGRLLANINSANSASIALFRKHGFGGPIQITLEKS